MIDEAKTIDDFVRITDLLASGEVSYAFPYDLKLLIIKYAAFVKQYVKTE